MNIKEKLLDTFQSIRLSNFFNKYYITAFAFVVWLSFFDRYNLMTQYKLSQNVKLLENKKQDYENLLEEALVERKIIKSDIEKYGREKYLFHKPDEEIILIK